MINWGFLGIRNVLLIGAVALLTRFAFYKAVNGLDGRVSPTDSSN